MGCPIGTVMSRLHRGRKLLQRALYDHALALGIVKGEEQVGEPEATPAAAKHHGQPGRVPRPQAGCGMTTHDCRDRARMLGSYLDGELEAAKLVEIDEHVGECETCREEAQLLRAMRGSLKRVVRAPAPGGTARPHRRRHVGRAGPRGRAGRRRRPRRWASKAPLVSLSSWRTMVPAGDGGARWRSCGARPRGERSRLRPRRAPASATICWPSSWPSTRSPCRSRRRTPDAVRGLEQYVGVPVRPAIFERAGLNAHLVGGRVVPLHSQRAAMLQYVVRQGNDTRRVSVVVYDAQKIQIGTANLVPARGRHRRGARRPREGLLRRGDAAGRRRLSGRERPRSGQERAARGARLRPSAEGARAHRPPGYPRSRACASST